ncbi:hypothetical protein PSM7751_01328 [Pseudooceanicola marinus]|uniref:Uncharacterized protein n=1 Tax=Pseudooceanicola marinus TaxID=396013 RepID=A0A1X6YTL2_9RHOB|nr:hypothetical protein [Pseudooceanicola marinus]SLN30895.1 hypothetical protein PSM7751_01328 [Pseudooceanicola marinus]
MRTRAFTATLSLVFVAALLVFDQATSDLNPYQAPPAFGLGSGEAATGGFCGALPN